MKIRTKLMLIQLPNVIIIGLIFATFILLTNTINNRLKAFLSGAYQSIVQLDRLLLTVETLDKTLIQFKSNQDIPGISIINHYITEFNNQLIIQSAYIKTSIEQERINEVQQKWLKYTSQITILLAQKNDEQILNNLNNNLFYELKAAIQNLITLKREELYLKSETFKNFVQQSYFYIILASLAIVISMLVTLSLITNKLLNPVDEFIHFAQNIASGNLQARITTMGNDELASLARHFNIMADKVEEYKNSTLGEQVYLRKVFRAAVNLIDDPLIIFDKSKQKLLLNKSAYELFNLSQDIEITYENAKNLVPKNVWLLLQQSGQKASAGIELKNKEFSVINNKIIKSDEAIDITLLMFKDNSKIDLKGFIKLEKIASVLEELLLPLTRIHLSIHICLEKSLGILTLKQEEFLFSARSDCYKMRKMISNLQNLQKLEDIAALAEKSSVSLSLILQECVKSLEIFAQARNVKLVMDFPPLPEDIDANKNQLALVINNLIDNAIYHSDDGGIIKLRIKESKNRVFFLIHNLGSFIPHEFKTRIFEKYFQLPGEKSEREGLGLYIARRIIEEHNGTIWVRSTAKSGTTFCFSIPKRRS